MVSWSSSWSPAVWSWSSPVLSWWFLGGFLVAEYRCSIGMVCWYPVAEANPARLEPVFQAECTFAMTNPQSSWRRASFSRVQNSARNVSKLVFFSTNARSASQAEIGFSSTNVVSRVFASTRVVRGMPPAGCWSSGGKC